MIHYLDNSATTSVWPSAAEKALKMMTVQYGNPSSLHSMGFEAEQEISKARNKIASFLSTDEKTIYFTSGGTEANNIALIGVAEAYKRRGNHIITSQIEHPSILKTCEKLEEMGYEVTYIAPKEDGCIDPEDVLSAIRKETILVSIMFVNNETGAYFPWETVANRIKKDYPQIILHSDAVQAFGKTSISLKKIPLDLLSCSGHKIGATKGIGALYIKKGVRVKPPIALGGGQEKGLRSGTENTPGIVSFGEAVNMLPPLSAQNTLYTALQQSIQDGLKDLENVHFHIPNKGIPYILHLSMNGIKSETLVHFLAEKNIFVSGGSACAKGNQSHVLVAMQLPKAEIDSSLRISLGPQNTQDDINALVSALHEARQVLVHT